MTITKRVTILDNESPNITYYSNGYDGQYPAWKFDRNVYSSRLYNHTESLSYQHNAYAILSFYGTGVEYWSNINFDHGPCELTLDGLPVGTVSSYSPVLGDPIMLYGAHHLAPGYHSLKIKVASRMHPNGCEIDRFVITEVPHCTGNRGSDTIGASNPSQTKSLWSSVSMDGGEIFKLSLAIMLLFALLRFWALRSLRKAQAEHQEATLEEANKTEAVLPSYSNVEKEGVSS